MKTLAIIQARMGSKRLPGKVLRPLAGKPLLHHLIERARRAKSLDGVVVATSVCVFDEAIVEFCKTHKVLYFRGPEEDVLKRYLLAASHFGASHIVRLTADCPLLDPQVIDLVVNSFKGELDYLSNTQSRGFPKGMDVEIFSKEALIRADREADGPYWREHVTAYLYSHPDRFRIGQITWRLTVDTEDDFALIERIAKKNPSSFSDIITLLQTHPEWISINGYQVL